MSYSFHNKLQDNAQSSDSFINKAVLTVASYTRTVYHKYNRIPVFYHLPFVFMETISKMGIFKHFICLCSINCFLSICFYIFGDLSKIILHLTFCIALWDIYYVHLVWEDIENDLNRIVDFLINLWDSFEISFLNFINVLGMVFDNLLRRQLIQFLIWN